MNKEELEKNFKEQKDRHDMLLSMQEMLASMSNDKRLMLRCKIHRFLGKITDDILAEPAVFNKDFTPVLNILDQLIQCYEDIK